MTKLLRSNKTHMKRLCDNINYDKLDTLDTKKRFLIDCVEKYLFSSQYKYVGKIAFSEKKFFLGKTIHCVFKCSEWNHEFKIIATDKYGNLWVYFTNDRDHFGKDHKLINMFGLSEKFKK